MSGSKRATLLSDNQDPFTLHKALKNEIVKFNNLVF